MTVFVQGQHRARPLSEREAEVYVASTCFKTGPPGGVGVEVERLVHDVTDPTLPVPAPRVLDAVASLPAVLPGGGRTSLEPGGQLELSSSCAPGLSALLRATREDLALLDGALADAGLRPGESALDAQRPPVRTLDLPRYEAMERCFDQQGPAGRTMMCSTASLQVCLDAGDVGDGPQSALRRWRRLHALAPVLVSMFANSPARAGRGRTWMSARQAQWLAMEPCRTACVPAHAEPRDAWAAYALDASVLCLRAPAGSWAAPRGLTMRGWLRGDGPRPATVEDVDYHLTTLFPPVRPRGFLEVRVVDAQKGEDWAVATAVVTALAEDDVAAERAERACAGLGGAAGAMEVAAREGLRHPRLRSAAQECMAAALAALPRLGAGGDLVDQVAAFADRYTQRGRAPADDRLDDLRRRRDTAGGHVVSLPRQGGRG